MNWAKAKSILIILFAALNIFLLVNLVKFYKTDDVSAGNIANTQKILADRGYILESRIPDNTKSGMLNYESGSYNRRAIAEKLLGDNFLPDVELKDGVELSSGEKRLSFQAGNTIIYTNKKPSEDINISDSRKVRKYAENFIKGLNLPINEYYMERSNSDGSLTLYFKERYKKYLVFYNEAEITLTKTGVTSFRCKFIKPLDMMPAKEIVPAYQILLKHFVNGDRTVITSIDAGFACSFHQGSIQASEALVWRIGIKGQKPLYFSAVNAEKMDIEGMFSD